MVRGVGNGARVPRVETTVGRIIFNEVLPEDLRRYNTIMDKKALKELVTETYRQCGNEQTAEILDAFAALSEVSWRERGEFRDAVKPRLRQRRRLRSLYIAPDIVQVEVPVVRGRAGGARASATAARRGVPLRRPAGIP